jgi:hypothetical protein
VIGFWLNYCQNAASSAWLTEDDSALQGASGRAQSLEWAQIVVVLAYVIRFREKSTHPTDAIDRVLPGWRAQPEYRGTSLDLQQPERAIVLDGISLFVLFLFLFFKNRLPVREPLSSGQSSGQGRDRYLLRVESGAVEQDLEDGHGAFRRHFSVLGLCSPFVQYANASRARLARVRFLYSALRVPLVKPASSVVDELSAVNRQSGLG